jgi:hypothetical protein
MKLTVQRPSLLDAEQVGETEQQIYKLKFYTHRRSSGGMVLTTTTDADKTLDRVLVKVSQDGRISLDRLNEEITPEVDSQGSSNE